MEPVNTMWRKDLCRCDYIKDLETGIVSQIICVGSECNHRFPYKKGRGKLDIQRRVGDMKARAERFEEAGLKDWNDAATSRGMLVATRS